MSRPSVDVVVPFAGAPEDLERTRERMSALALGPEDSLTIVNNNDDPVATPAYARNRGAERGQAEWLQFLDADIQPSPDLLDRLFDPPPGERTALLAGSVHDEPVPRDAPAAARYAYLRKLLSHESTLKFGEWGFPNSANLACRREVFESVGGFREGIRAGEDGDLTLRLKQAGWGFELREEAVGVHHSRQTVRELVLQKACHGAGAAWLDREYPGSIPARRRPGLVFWGMRFALKGLARAARRHDLDAARWAVLEPLEQLSYEFGRSLPNERPLPERSPWRLVLRRR